MEFHSFIGICKYLLSYNKRATYTCNLQKAAIFGAPIAPSCYISIDLVILHIFQKFCRFRYSCCKDWASFFMAAYHVIYIQVWCNCLQSKFTGSDLFRCQNWSCSPLLNWWLNEVHLPMWSLSCIFRLLALYFETTAVLHLPLFHQEPCVYCSLASMLWFVIHQMQQWKSAYLCCLSFGEIYLRAWWLALWFYALFFFEQLLA